MLDSISRLKGAEKESKWMEILNDRPKGMNYTELSKKYHIDPQTAKKYAESAQRPEYTLTETTPTKLDEYKQQVDLWLEEMQCCFMVRTTMCPVCS